MNLSDRSEILMAVRVISAFKVAVGHAWLAASFTGYDKTSKSKSHRFMPSAVRVLANLLKASIFIFLLKTKKWEIVDSN